MSRLHTTVLAFLLSACAGTPTSDEPFHIIAGTAPGDPCTPDHMLVDTPRGYPRLCVNGKWQPICETINLHADWGSICAGYRGMGMTPAKQ